MDSKNGGDPKIQGNKIFSDFVSIGDFSTLSVVEIITLHLLLKYPRPVIRYTLYQEVKQFLHPIKKDNKKPYFEPLSGLEHRFYEFLKEKKRISTSSFYNNLKNLELRGLVKFVEDDNGKLLVRATKLSNYFLKFLFQFIAQLITGDYELEVEVAKMIEEKIRATKNDSLLLVWLKKIIDFNIIDYLRNQVDEMYFLSEKNLYEDLLKFDFNDVSYTRVHNNLIREPNEIFDIILVPHYKKNGNRLELKRIELLNELFRVSKKGGSIVLVTRAELPRTSNHYANQLLELYEDYFRIQGRIFTSEELESDMKEIGLDSKSYEIVEFKGLIITIISIN
jgi:hypothetical protein